MKEVRREVTFKDASYSLSREDSETILSHPSCDGKLKRFHCMSLGSICPVIVGMSVILIVSCRGSKRGQMLVVVGIKTTNKMTNYE
jgi:hypothetical protein